MGPSWDRPLPYIICFSASLKSLYNSTLSCFTGCENPHQMGSVKLDEREYAALRPTGIYGLIMLTPVTPPSYLTSNQRIARKLITHPVTTLIHLAFKNVFLVDN